MEPQVQKNNLSIPLAIVVAGALIAAALFFSRNGGVAVKTPPQKHLTSTIQNLPVTDKDHILGSADADVVVIEYSDTECPFCKNFHSTLNDLVEKYGKDKKMSWVYRHFPLYKADKQGRSLHSRAGKEAEATECAAELGGNTKFWEYTNELYRITPSNNELDPAQLPIIAKTVGLDTKAFQTCLSSSKYADEISLAYDQAVEAGGRGTPHVIIISKNEITEKKAEQIIQFSKDAIAQIAPDTEFPESLYMFDKEGHKVAFSGALPHQIIDGIVQILSR